ncbi:isopenicillin N synthase family dioxygenase [Cupriavidus sp. 2KB_3]|uniref:isopenicillin N synthase family dioxygenase n=1 Tax=Cupriavidus sp. 2KB_3 TaxID=3232980 RepID=UPI003F919135
MTATAPASSASLSLPLIDIAGLRSADPAARRAVATQLHDACAHRGFFYLTNHGIDPALIRSVFAASQRFFDLSMADKLAVDKRLSPCNRGYEPLRAQTLEAGAPPDLKESFYIGAEIAADDPRVLAGRFNTGPNQWPATLPAFRAVMEAYYQHAYALGATVVRGLALALDLPEDHFDGYLHDASATLRLLHYPPQPAQPQPGEKGCGEHTDFGGVTLLLQDETGGLQVWDALQASWIDAPPVPGAFVVNIGDLFARWTNDRYVSTLHRVINRSGRERYSVPFFFTGNPLHEVACLPTCRAEGETAKYPPVTVEQHLMDCYRRTYG